MGRAASFRPEGARLLPALRRMIGFRLGEGRALAWAWLYVCALFLAYYVLRPIRDEFGTVAGAENLSWLFTGTLLAMLAANPLFSYAVRRWPRERFIAVAYRCFMLNLLAFMGLLQLATPAQHLWIGRAFFIWISVFNLFAVSVFWSFVVDVFNAEQGKRLFGVVAAGATLGGLAGSALTAGLVGILGQSQMLFAAILLLEVAVLAVRRLSRMGGAMLRPMAAGDADAAIGGGLLAGVTHTVRSPYLLGSRASSCSTPSPRRCCTSSRRPSRPASRTARPARLSSPASICG